MATSSRVLPWEKPARSAGGTLAASEARSVHQFATHSHAIVQAFHPSFRDPAGHRVEPDREVVEVPAFHIHRQPLVDTEPVVEATTARATRPGVFSRGLRVD